MDYFRPELKEVIISQLLECILENKSSGFLEISTHEAPINSVDERRFRGQESLMQVINKAVGKDVISNITNNQILEICFRDGSIISSDNSASAEIGEYLFDNNYITEDHRKLVEQKRSEAVGLEKFYEKTSYPYLLKELDLISSEKLFAALNNYYLSTIINSLGWTYDYCSYAERGFPKRMDDGLIDTKKIINLFRIKEETLQNSLVTYEYMDP